MAASRTAPMFSFSLERRLHARHLRLELIEARFERRHGYSERGLERRQRNALGKGARRRSQPLHDFRLRVQHELPHLRLVRVALGADDARVLPRLLRERVGHLRADRLRHDRLLVHAASAAAASCRRLSAADCCDQPRLHRLIPCRDARLALGDGLLDLLHVRVVAGEKFRRIEDATEVHFLHQHAQAPAQVQESVLVRRVRPHFAQVGFVLELAHELNRLLGQRTRRVEGPCVSRLAARVGLLEAILGAHPLRREALRLALVGPRVLARLENSCDGAAG